MLLRNWFYFPVVVLAKDVFRAIRSKVNNSGIPFKSTLPTYVNLAFLELVPLLYPCSYLPLSHIAGLLFDLYANLGGVTTVYFADKSALKGRKREREKIQ